jgi:hypothetical protein
MMLTTIRVAVASAAILAVASAASPQQAAVTQADIQRLQDNVYLADRDVSQLRNRDSSRASQLQTQLDDLRDEVVYLKVKLRKERTLTRNEYADVRDRIESVRSSARGETSTFTGVPSTSQPSTSSSSSASVPSSTSGTSRSTSSTSSNATSEVPVGTEFDVRLQATLDSGTAQVEDRFEATTMADILANGRTVIPAGSLVRGVVSAVEPATRTNRTARLTVSFDQVTVNGRAYPIRATVTEAIEGSGVKGEAGRIGAGAGVGAIIGGILGGVKGALAGLAIGGGGVLVATEGKQVEVPQGTILRVRLDSPVQIR